MTNRFIEQNKSRICFSLQFSKIFSSFGLQDDNVFNMANLGGKKGKKQIKLYKISFWKNVAI